MEKNGIARFPRPAFDRIPNFAGAEEAAKRLGEFQAFQHARVVKVNPDASQLPVRRAALTAGKRVLMPAPRLRSGFLLLDPQKMPSSKLTAAASINGAFRVIETLTERIRPAGILWEHITEKMLEEMPALRALQKMRS